MRTEPKPKASESKPLSSQHSVLSPSKRRGGARAVAQAVLVELERAGGMADDLLDDRLDRCGLDARDRGLSIELTYGVLRHQATLDWRLDQVADQAVRRLPSFVRNALRAGAYQLLYLDRIPPSAAVNDSVELVKRGRPSARKRWAPFVNAVLRALIREPVPPWPDPIKDPVAALSIRYACPSWLTERRLTRLGPEQAEALCRATLTIPPLTFRTNTLRVGREELLADLARAGYATRPTPVSPLGLVVDKCGRVTDLPQFGRGLCYVEDEAGQLVPPLLDPQPGERLLDACAAPGGKATHLAALMQSRGEIVAMDRSPDRLRLLQENCRRLGVTIITPVQADLTSGRDRAASRLLGDRPFDGILVDAPCSGLGVLKRHPEAKWQKTAGALLRHQATQLHLLERASALLRPGGRIVYSTCSTEPEENEHVIDRFCKKHKEFRRESVEPWLPQAGQFLLTVQGDLSTIPFMHSHSLDGFFACRLRKAHR